ncbi:MAG: hypothetical protein J3Q66DRAFT_126030 [Benniella sp.]|nr:MAG: hypothetical protein J3Q66DRAFT_126030 [Benniella sp.]
MIWSGTHLTLTLSLFYFSVYIDAEQDGIKTQECCGGVVGGCRANVLFSHRSDCLDGLISSVHRCGAGPNKESGVPWWCGGG